MTEEQIQGNWFWVWNNEEFDVTKFTLEGSKYSAQAGLQCQKLIFNIILGQSHVIFLVSTKR